MNAPAAAASAEAHHENHLPVYVRVIITLAVLTTIEFGIAAVIAPSAEHVRPASFLIGVLALIALAAWKAVLVARFFMHIKYDPKILAVLALTPVVLGTPLVLLCVYDGINGFAM